MTPDKAHRQIRNSIWVGIIFLAVGGSIMGAAWPGTELDGYSSDFGPRYTETGDSGLVFFGLIIAAFGQAFLLVGLIGVGVSLGRQASPTVAVPTIPPPPPRAS
ncbi:MAG: hypothetical protein CMH83_20015 [Nocardioides sp.]|nr:hypothetical protein [Nocardioides sp.]